MQIKQTSRFKKDYKKIVRQGHDISRLRTVLNLLFDQKVLDARYHNHRLIDTNEFDDCFELHIGPDWLLIYKYSKDHDVLYLVRTGSHSDLYE